MTDLLLCVDGSPAGTAAAIAAVRLAADLHATLHALFVLEDSGLSALVDKALDGHGAGERMMQTGDALHTRVCTIAAERGITVDWIVEQGEPFERILECARRVQPRFIVMGRTGRRGPGRTLVGTQVEHTLEFTEWPVIVVPTERSVESP